MFWKTFVEKRENGGYQNFLLFHHLFKRLLSQDHCGKKLTGKEALENSVGKRENLANVTCLFLTMFSNLLTLYHTIPTFKNPEERAFGKIMGIGANAGILFP